MAWGFSSSGRHPLASNVCALLGAVCLVIAAALVAPAAGFAAAGVCLLGTGYLLATPTKGR